MVILNYGDKRVDIKCPERPNFIKVDGVMRSLDFLTEKEIKEVAKEFEYHLLNKWRERKDTVLATNEGGKEHEKKRI